MTAQSYSDGFHSYLFPADAIPGDDADWQQGWEDAQAMSKQVRSKPTLTAHLTDEGLIDMFVIGPDGVPLARKGHEEGGVFIPDPTLTGEEAETAARAWMAAQQDATEEPATVGA